MDTAPCTRLFQVAGHDDGFVCRTYCIDFTALFHKDIIYDVVITDGSDGYTLFDDQRCTVLYDVLAAQFIGIAGFQGYIRGDGAFQCSAVFNSVAILSSGSVVVVAA